MRTHVRLIVLLLFVAAIGYTIDFSLCPAITLVAQPAQTKVYATNLSPIALPADAIQQPQDKTAEQIYHNIQALKGVPAPQLQQVMALFTGALGVKCSYCHTNPFEKDDRPAKHTARRMIQMVFDLNRGNFGGKDAITCYTCHRGKPKPETVVVLGTTPG